MYTVAKVERSTGRIAAVLARGMANHHADMLRGIASREVEEGYYISVINENDERLKAVDHPPPGVS